MVDLSRLVHTSAHRISEGEGRGCALSTPSRRQPPAPRAHALYSRLCAVLALPYHTTAAVLATINKSMFIFEPTHRALCFA